VYVLYSTRLALLSDQVADHINTYMHPQALIVDDLSKEESFFARHISEGAKAMHINRIEIPHGEIKQLAWITKLDSSSLAGK
jgi:hypothetical protein